MNVERDPLADLTAAWRAETPPDPTAVLDTPDPATRATIAWLRDAWRASAPAVPRDGALPWRVRLQLARRRAQTLAPWLAAAAAALLAVSLFLDAPTRSPLASRLDGGSEPVVAVDVALEPVSFTADRMELRSGPVRLILLTPTSESNR